MAIVGVTATNLGPVGGINTTGSGTVTHHFASSSIFSYPTLRNIEINDDDGACVTTVSQFVDGSGTHNVSFIGVFASACTSVTFKLVGEDCVGEALCMTRFFG